MVTTFYIVIDGKVGGSMVTRINHSDNPNVVAVKRFLRVEGNTRLATGLFLKANKNICANMEELIWDYGENYPTNFA